MKLIFLLPLLIDSAIYAQEPDSSSVLYQLREAERNFARASVMVGRNASFVESLADESVIFNGTWMTNGRQYWKERKVAPVVLKWEPEFMYISASRDFGISTGPWEAQEYRPNTSPVSTGYFLSVWKKEPGGVWKVILDAGSATPPAAGSGHTFSFPAGADKPLSPPVRMNVSSLENELSGREEQFLAEWKRNPSVATYSGFLVQSVRLQRNGRLPSVHADTVKAWLGKTDKKLSWKLAGSGAADSGDLGFTFGFLEIPGGSPGMKGHYVRIWRKQPEGTWKIILEMMSFD